VKRYRTEQASRIRSKRELRYALALRFLHFPRLSFDMDEFSTEPPLQQLRVLTLNCW
jgi:hypothetical protein